MNYKRFGRLNTKMLNEYKKNNSPLYEMAKLFIYSTTRKISMDRRHTIVTFKKMMKKYRYCYKLYSDCIAIKKVHGTNIYDYFKEIDNKVYVFTDIPYTKIDNDYFEVIYDRDELIRISKDNYDDNSLISNVIDSMEERRFPKIIIKDLKSLFSTMSILPIQYENIPSEYKSSITRTIFEEFRLRCLLYHTDIYKINNNTLDEIEFTKQQSNKNFTIKDFSLLKNIDKYYSTSELIKDIVKDIEVLEEYGYYGFDSLKDYQSFKEYSKIQKIKNKINESHQLLDIYKDRLLMLKDIYYSYTFINEPYSKEYKTKFKQYRQILSKWKTQEVFKKYRKEHIDIENKIEELNNAIIKYDKPFKTINKFLNQYENSLHENGLANNGFGYLEQYDDEDNNYINPQTDELDISAQYRLEEKVQIELDTIANNDEKYKSQLKNKIEYEKYMQDTIEYRFNRYNKLSPTKITLKQYQYMEQHYDYVEYTAEDLEYYNYDIPIPLFEQDLIFEQVQKEEFINTDISLKEDDKKMILIIQQTMN